MSERQLRHYRMKLYKETSDIKSSFDSLVFHLQKNVKESYQVEDIARLLKSHENELEKPLRECATISDVFDNAASIWSFYNYRMIKSTSLEQRVTKKIWRSTKINLESTHRIAWFVNALRMHFVTRSTLKNALR